MSKKSSKKQAEENVEPGLKVALVDETKGRRGQPSDCPTAFGRKPDKFLHQCLTCPVDEDCLVATPRTRDVNEHQEQVSSAKKSVRDYEDAYLEELGLELNVASVDETKDRPVQPRDCPKAFGQRPEMFSPQCLYCRVEGDCQTATRGTCNGRDYEDDYLQFKDILAVQGDVLLRRTFISHVSKWTGTQIGWYMEIPHCVQDTVFKFIMDKYHHLWCDYDQQAGELPEVTANSACIAAGDAFVHLSGRIDGIIEEHQKETIEEIATIALNALPSYNSRDFFCP